MISVIPKKPHQFAQNRNILILLSSDSERSRYVRLWVVNGYFVSSGQVDLQGLMELADEFAASEGRLRNQTR
jgi:hypothetical protein